MRETFRKGAYLYVERDDSEYDYKAGFSSFSDANEYRLEQQRQWLSHCDYVYLAVPIKDGSSWARLTAHFNLTKMSQEERNKMLNYYNIPE